MARVEFHNVVVRYPVYTTNQQRSLLSFAAHTASFGQLARGAGQATMVDALCGISFRLKDGDRLALIGRNGSGKTTILKTCAGLAPPDSGELIIEGSRATILTPGAGLNHERTGAENVDMVGRLLGIPRKRRAALLEDVAQFTELGDFLGMPVHTYSSGMTVRLMFALATSVERDIVIVDEVIGAGDAHFVKKAAARVRDLFSRAKILVLATHAGTIASQLCTSAMWVDSGREVLSGDPNAVWEAYVNHPAVRAMNAVA